MSEAQVLTLAVEAMHRYAAWPDKAGEYPHLTADEILTVWLRQERRDTPREWVRLATRCLNAWREARRAAGGAKIRRRLTEADRRAVAQAVAAGEARRSVAARYGLSYSGVWKILTKYPPQNREAA
jgi:hypothetical protein